MKSFAHDAPLISKTATRFSVSLMTLIGLTAVMGWIFNLPFLTSISSDWIAIQPNTIMCFMLFSIGLWLLPNGKPFSKIIILCCITLAFIISLCTFYTNLNTYISSLYIGRMSIVTVFNFIIISFAFFLMLGKQQYQATAQYFLLVSLFIPTLVLLGYLYNDPFFFIIANHSDVSFITAVLFVLLPLTAFFSNPTPGIANIFKGSKPGSLLTRYLIPVAILIPVIFGYLHFRGSPRNLPENIFDIAELTLFTVLSFVPIIWFIAIQLNITNEELQESKEKLASALHAKSAFLSAMSHEIRTPLNGVIGMAQLLSDTSLTPEQQEYAKTIELSGKALLNIINDILDFSKIESGRLELENIDFDLKKSITETITIMSLHAHKKNLTLTANIHPDVPIWINGDPTHLNQILINLLSNAIKFTAAGSIALSVSFIKNNLRFEVKDTGIGISPEVKEKLFKSFSQGDISTTRKYGGSGLGLVISKRLVEFMHGEIGVDSIPNKGSTFWFTIPYIPALTEKNISEIKPIAQTEFSKEIKILIAEDNDINQQVILSMLKKLGLKNITVANDGLATLSALEKNSYDLIFMDCEMPEMNGYDATRQIRKTYKKHIPIVAMTAHALQGDKEKCLDAGMDDYIAKPIDRNELIRVLQELK